MIARTLRALALLTLAFSTMASNGGGCQPAPVICGGTTCEPGQVCCNPSCGSCTAPGDACVQIGCEPPPSTGGACRSNSDCRTFSDYCTGCDCRALSICEKDPVCPGPGVQCLVDPCSGKEALCDGGRCVLHDRRAECPAGSCGPQLGMPNYLCPDGKTVAGPSSRCLANPDSTCGWEIVQCPDPSVCSPCAAGLEWCTLKGGCTYAACLACCQFGRVCQTAADCGGPACVTCPSGAAVCSTPDCGSVVPSQCNFPQPVCT